METLIDQFVKEIPTVGFPIVVALYFIFTLNKTLQTLVASIQSLEKTVEHALRSANK
jgi:hypothetical protein